jgi:soluble lytic murein transglycosylase-like protein
MSIKTVQMMTLIVGLLVPSISHQIIIDLPSVNLTTVFEHQKELVGSKRMPNSIRENKNADQIASLIIFEIVRESLPKEYASQSQLVARTIIEQGNRYKMDPLLIASVIRHESNFNPLIVGLVGEIGLMQIRPTTAKWLNDKAHIVKKLDLRNPVTNIKVGAYFLNKLRNKFNQNGRYYLSAYNMGVAKLRQNLKQNVNPKEYVGNVMKYYVSYLNRFENASEKSLKMLEAEQIVRTAQLCTNEVGVRIAHN